MCAVVFQVLVHSENKRNKPRGNARCVQVSRPSRQVDELTRPQSPHLKPPSSSVVQERGCALQKIEEAIHTSPCVLGSKGQPHLDHPAPAGGSAELPPCLILCYNRRFS